MHNQIERFVRVLAKRLKCRAEKIHDSTLGTKWVFPYKGKISRKEISKTVSYHFNQGKYHIKGFDMETLTGTLYKDDEIQGVIAVHNDTQQGIADVVVHVAVPRQPKLPRVEIYPVVLVV